VDASPIDRALAQEMPLADVLGLCGLLHVPAGGQPPHPRLQTYLDALPIAAGLIERSSPIGGGGPMVLVARNRRFERIFHDPAASAEGWDALATFLAGHAASLACPKQFAWSEPQVGGRHFRVHFVAVDGNLAGRDLTLVTLIDCTAAVETERSLRFEMLHDSLTGLPNRLAFTEALDAAIEAGEAAETLGRFAVVAVNLARFSRVNESIGTLAGDELIVTVARRLTTAMRAGDLLARMTGDEFAILVPLLDGPGDALHVARKVREALTQPLRLTDLELRIDCAIGLAVWHEQTPSAHDIIRNAQFAVKRSKVSGRVEIYEPGEAGRAHRRFSLEAELALAIGTDQMHLAFQPLVDLDDGRISGFEALARWTHPTRGEIPPVEFIAVAEEAGLIVPLGRWVIDRAAATLRRWDDRAERTLPLYLGVNVSAVQLARDSVATVVDAALADHGIDGDRLTFELTESSIVADPVRAARVLDSLKRLSCRIAMDDFGTGFSSLASLQRLPIDILKIDREFVRGMLDDRDSTAIVRAILSLATALGMSTVAEGIESRQSAHTLAALGCRVGQGYYFSRPLPEEEALAYFLKGHVAAV
jgi:diguanylate cyclase (GGDEF)-like protein